MTFHRRMIVVGLLVASSGSALASSASRHLDIGELQRRGEEGRGVVEHRKPSSAEDPAVSPPTGLGLGEHQQRGEEGRGESRAGPPTEASSGGRMDIGDAQRRGEEGRAPAPGSPTRQDVATRR